MTFNKLCKFLLTFIKSFIILSARYGNWARQDGRPTPTRSGPRIIVFIVGGISYNEMRCAYEVSKDKKPWEIIVGNHEYYGCRFLSFFYYKFSI